MEPFFFSFLFSLPVYSGSQGQFLLMNFIKIKVSDKNLGYLWERYIKRRKISNIIHASQFEVCSNSKLSLAVFYVCNVLKFPNFSSSNAKGYITLGIKLKSVNVMKGALHDLALVCLSGLISDQSNLPSGHTGQCGLRQMCHDFSCCRSPTLNSSLDFTDSSSSLLHPLSFLLTFRSIYNFNILRKITITSGPLILWVSSHTTQNFT